MFEDALAPNVIMRWVDLTDWWAFWRGGKITKYSILRALESGYEAALFDADWFLNTIRSHGGKLKGTDVLSEGLSKEDLSEWVRNIHESADGTAKGILGALGWDKIVAKTADSVLIAVVDAIALKVALVAPKETAAEQSGNGSGGGAGEQAIDDTTAATLFRDEEMISVGEWEDGKSTRPPGSRGSTAPASASAKPGPGK
jgi:hypothetical protein